MLGESEALTGWFDASTLLIATPLILEVTAYVSGSGSSVAAVGIEQSRTEQETRSEQSRFFGLNEQDLLTGQDQSELSN